MGNAKTMRPSMTEPASNYVTKLAYDSSNNLEYLGRADYGTATSAATWHIRKFTYDSSNNLTDIETADGDDAFNNVWDDRATISFS